MSICLNILPITSLLIPISSAAILVMTAGCEVARTTPSPTQRSGPLAGKTVAILATDGVEQSEPLEPRQALEQAGAKTVVIAPHGGTIKTWKDKEWGTTVTVDRVLSDARPYEYDALLLPGGTMNPDQLRIDPQACAFAVAFVTAGKPIAAICHGPWLLIETGGVKGRRMTSWPSLKSDLTNAGALWVDETVVVDHQLVTSRKPQDIPDFNREMIQVIAAHVATSK